VDFSGLTFIITENCNFSCSYCRQIKTKKVISSETIRRTLDFFFPSFSKDFHINFYGGEPLLAFDRIKEAVDLVKEKNLKTKKNVQFSMSTNGSLLDAEIIRFLDLNSFSLLLSYDGVAQKMSRQGRSSDRVEGAIAELIEYPHIRLRTNSVFMPSTVHLLSDSVAAIIKMKVPDVSLSFSTHIPWTRPGLELLQQELSKVRKSLQSLYEKEGTVPVGLYRKRTRKGKFFCSAGKDRMTITTEGEIVGCHVFVSFLKNDPSYRSSYSFGQLTAFIENHKTTYPNILENYDKLRMERFHTEERWCMFCENLEFCSICPVDAAYTSQLIGRIPSWICELKKILRIENDLFWGKNTVVDVSPS
jgi:radical SAM protein with 4Fe4S-binding SPASM domain